MNLIKKLTEFKKSKEDTLFKEEITLMESIIDNSYYINHYIYKRGEIPWTVKVWPSAPYFFVSSYVDIYHAEARLNIHGCSADYVLEVSFDDLFSPLTPYTIEIGRNSNILSKEIWPTQSEAERIYKKARSKYRHQCFKKFVKNIFKKRGEN